MGFEPPAETPPIDRSIACWSRAALPIKRERGLGEAKEGGRAVGGRESFVAATRSERALGFFVVRCCSAIQGHMGRL